MSSNHEYVCDSPDLGFIPATVRSIYDRDPEAPEDRNPSINVYGAGSLGTSCIEILKQLDIWDHACCSSIDTGSWEKRNFNNTLHQQPGTERNVGDAKAIQTHCIMTEQETYALQQRLQITRPIIYILATDNLLTRAKLYKEIRDNIYLYRGIKGADNTDLMERILIIDLRSSQDLIRTIITQPLLIDRLPDADVDTWAAFSEIYYPPITKDVNNNWTWDGDIDHDARTAEGGCQERGSLMHTLTAVTSAIQIIFRSWQHKSLPTFGVYDQMPWTNNSQKMELRVEDQTPQPLTNFVDTYPSKEHLTNLIRSNSFLADHWNLKFPYVKVETIPPWTTALNTIGNTLLYTNDDSNTTFFNPQTGEALEAAQPDEEANTTS